MQIADLFTDLLPGTRVPEAERHYRLAMKAARRIARTRGRDGKARAGHLVCQHLQAMLEADGPIRSPCVEPSRPRPNRVRPHRAA